MYSPSDVAKGRTNMVSGDRKKYRRNDVFSVQYSAAVCGFLKRNKFVTTIGKLSSLSLRSFIAPRPKRTQLIVRPAGRCARSRREKNHAIKDLPPSDRRRQTVAYKEKTAGQFKAHVSRTTESAADDEYYIWRRV